MGYIVKCAACEAEKSFTEMKFCMHANREYAVCSGECMDDFYKGLSVPKLAPADKADEFFNNADSVQVEEGTWYYHESSVRNELISLHEQLAKANERVKELELVVAAITHAEDEVYVDDWGLVERWSDVGEEAKSLLNKFAIENQIKGVDGIKANCNLYKASPTDKMIARECITVEEVDSYHWYLKKQLRKEQE